MTAYRMTAFRRGMKGVSLLAVACVTLGACSSIPLLNRIGGGDDDDGVVASQGQRLSIVAFEQKVEPAKSLKGVGYYIPPAQPVAEWRMSGGPQDAVIQNADAAKSFRVAWTKSIGTGGKGESQVLAQPVSDGRLIYTLDGEARISAFDVNTGSQAWSVDLNPNIKRDKLGFGGGLALSEDGKLYVTSGFRFVAALDAATGATLWQKTVDTQLHAAPVVNDKYVMATDVDNQIFAFNRENGDMDWTYQAIAEPARLLKTASPILSGDTVYAPFSSGELVALTTSNGQPQWTQVLAKQTRTNAISEIRDISGRPVLFNGTIFAASHSGVFQAMNARTGEPVWSIAADSTNSPWVAGDVVFLLTVQGELLAANRDSGLIYWIRDLNEGEAAGESKGFFGIGKGAKDARKLPQWTGPVIANSRLVLVNSEGQAVAFDAVTGEPIERINIGGAAYIAPIAVGDKLFVVTENAKLVAIH